MELVGVASSAVTFAEVVFRIIRLVQNYQNGRELKRALAEKTIKVANDINRIAAMIIDEANLMLESDTVDERTEQWYAHLHDIISTLKGYLDEMKHALRCPEGWVERKFWSSNLDKIVQRIEASTSQQLTLLTLALNIQTLRNTNGLRAERPILSLEDIALLSNPCSVKMPKMGVPKLPVPSKRRTNSIQTIDSNGTLAEITDEYPPPPLDNKTVDLHKAIRSRNAEEVQRLIRAGANLKAYDREGLSAMHHCAEKGGSKILKVIKKNRKDIHKLVNYPDRLNQRTPLHIAAAHGQHTFGVLAIECGALIDIIDADGLTPYSTADRKNKLEFLSMIKQQQRLMATEVAVC